MNQFGWRGPLTVSLRCPRGQFLPFGHHDSLQALQTFINQRVSKPPTKHKAEPANISVLSG